MFSSSSKEDTANLDSMIAHTCGRLGYPDIRPSQHTAIKSFLQGKDVFICLPTGSGKSLCYAALPYALDGLYCRESIIAIVVSPLIALMKDQANGVTTYLWTYKVLIYFFSGCCAEFKRHACYLY